MRLVQSVTFNILAKHMLVYQLSLQPVECSVCRFLQLHLALHCSRMVKHLYVNVRTIWGNRGTASCILKLGTKYEWPALFPGHLPLGKVLFVPSEEDISFTIKLVWAFWKKKISLVPAWN